MYGNVYRIEQGQLARNLPNRTLFCTLTNKQ